MKSVWSVMDGDLDLSRLNPMGHPASVWTVPASQLLVGGRQSLLKKDSASPILTLSRATPIN